MFAMVRCMPCHAGHERENVFYMQADNPIPLLLFIDSLDSTIYLYDHFCGVEKREPFSKGESRDEGEQGTEIFSLKA